MRCGAMLHDSRLLVACVPCICFAAGLLHDAGMLRCHCNASCPVSGFLLNAVLRRSQLMFFVWLTLAIWVVGGSVAPAHVVVEAGGQVTIMNGGILAIGVVEPTESSSPPSPPPSPPPSSPPRYTAYEGRACSGRNEVFTSPLQASAEDCMAHCSSFDACISVEWTPSNGKCYGSSSCTFELSIAYASDTLYVRED